MVKISDQEAKALRFPNTAVNGHIKTLTNYFEHVGSSCPITGFELTDNLDGTVNIGNGSAILRDTESVHTSTLVEYDVYGVTNQVLIDNATNYIFASYNGGVPQLSLYASIPDSAGMTEVPVWFLTRIGNDIHIVDMRNFGLNYPVANSKKDFYVNQIEHAFGTVLSEGITPRSIALTAGRFYLTSVALDHDAFDTNTSTGPDTFTSIYRDGLGGWTRVASQKTIPNTTYDNGTGSLATLGQNDYGVYWVFLVLNTPSELYMLYGQSTYNTLAAAQAAMIPNTIPPEFGLGSSSKIVAKVIVLKSAVNFTEIRTPFIEAFTTATPTIHNGLGGIQGGQSLEYYHQTLAQAAHVTDTDLVASKSVGTGIKIDTDVPTWCWRDITGQAQIRSTGSNDPTFSLYEASTIRQFLFSPTSMNELYLNYHIPHDYVIGTDLYIHVHWSQTTVDTGNGGAPGNAKWYFVLNYAKGHDQAAFLASANVKTASVVQTASSTIRQHMIAEAVITDGVGTALLDRSTIEPDGIIFCRMYRDGADVADTVNVGTFVHFVDIHYQSKNVGTKQKAPNFFV